MNRNVESHFSQVPSADIPRSRFDRSQDVKFTFNVGELIPFFVEEVLPGDTFDITTSKVVRLQTLLTPVMDNMYLDTYFFFVPNRLIWSHWKNFMGESERAWTPEVEYTVPVIPIKDLAGGTVGSGAVRVGDVLDYLGVPVGVSYPYTEGDTAQLDVNALPFRAYLKIYDDWFRDENLIDPINIRTGDTELSWFEQGSLRTPFKVAKFHDYFTSALPSPAKVTTPVSAPVKESSGTGSSWNAPVITSPIGHGFTGNALYGVNSSGAGSRTNGKISVSDSFNLVYSSGSLPNSYPNFEPTNLYAQIQNSSLGVFITDLRYAVAVQQFYELLGRGGSRYIEIIASMFNVQSPDQRLQRSEYLGGNRVPISIHQITNQSQGENAFLGDLGAMSLTTDKHSDFVKSFVEHGFIIGLVCARYDHSYPQGLEKFWFRRSRFSYYWPVFANLSEQAILKGEIFWTADKSDGEFISNQTFGYQERYADYRYKPNRVAGEMRPGIANTLDSWHFADFYTEAPTLSKQWIQEDKTNVDRTLAVTSAVSNQLFCDVYVQNFATRPMPVYSVPGLYRM